MHLHQSILKENIDLTMQLLISENKQSTSREKKIEVCNWNLPDFPLSFFCRMHIKSSHYWYLSQNFFQCIFYCKNLFLRKLKYNDNTISTQCDQSLTKNFWEILHFKLTLNLSQIILLQGNGCTKSKQRFRSGEKDKTEWSKKLSYMKKKIYIYIPIFLYI